MRQQLLLLNFEVQAQQFREWEKEVITCCLLESN